MRLVDTIDRLSDLTLSKQFQRKAEACFLLVSRVVPFYSRYALTVAKPYPLRDHTLFLWSQYRVGSTVSEREALQLESCLPDADPVQTPESQLATYGQNAVICALHLTWYLSTRDDAYVKGCVVNYFDHIDYLAQERAGSNSGVPALADLLVARSRLFRRETADFETALLRDERESVVSRQLLIKNMDRDVSGFFGSPGEDRSS